MQRAGNCDDGFHPPAGEGENLRCQLHLPVGEVGRGSGRVGCTPVPRRFSGTELAPTLPLRERVKSRGADLCTTTDTCTCGTAA